MRVLVVDDDKEVARLLARDLNAHGYAVDTVGLAQHALAAAADTEYALMVVDLGLPDGDGLELVRQMRRRGSQTPILVVTARRRVEDRVLGLVSGADDYLVKPFALPELRARVLALLRRPGRLDRSSIAVGNITIDREALEAGVEGKSLDLTRKQFALLELLVRRKGHLTPKRMIEEALYGFDDSVSPNSVEAHVYKLRQALGAAGAHAVIETRRGIGYRLVETAAADPPRDQATSEDLARLDPDGSFRQRLAEDRTELEELARKLRQGSGRAALSLVALAHRLAGAAGTFGYGRVGIAAGALEDRAEACRSARGAKKAEALAAIETDLGGLVATIDTALRPTRKRARG